MCKRINANDLFAYTTPKLVRIHDKRLGILNYVLMFGILIYVVVYNILYSNQAFYFGTSTFSRRSSDSHNNINNTHTPTLQKLQLAL